jgi:hypothetical protein
MGIQVSGHRLTKSPDLATLRFLFALCPDFGSIAMSRRLIVTLMALIFATVVLRNNCVHTLLFLAAASSRLLCYQPKDIHLPAVAPVRLGPNDLIANDPQRIEEMKERVLFGNKFLPALHHDNSSLPE